MRSMYSKLFVVLALHVATVLCQQDDADTVGGASDAASTRSGASADGSPQTRFFPGLLNLFSSCSRCSLSDRSEADKCCRRGETQCCFEQPSFFSGGGFQPGFNGFNGGFQQGFGQPGFNPAFGGFHPGFQQGFHGGFPQFQGGFNSGVKPGVCRRPGFLGLNLRSGDGAAGAAGPGLRSAATPDAANDGSSTRVTRQVRFPGQSNAEQTADAAASGTETRSGAAGDDGANPSTRFFLPNPFGPGPILPNPLCRDECFNDFDCVGNLKCCLRDCNKCENPSFHGLF